MQNAVRRKLSVLTLISLTGCHIGSALDYVAAGEPRISDSVWFRTYGNGTQSSDASEPTYVPPTCYTTAPNPSPPPAIYYADVKQPSDIVACVTDMKTVIDRRFDKWIDNLSAVTSDSNLLADTVVIGAGLAGGLAGGATSRIMNAVTSGVTGVKGKVDEDIFVSQSIRIIINQMNTDRAKWGTIIDDRLLATTAAQPSLSGAQSAPKPRVLKSTVRNDVTTQNNVTTATTTHQTTTQASPTGTTQAADTTTARPYATLGEAWNDLLTYSRQGSFVQALNNLNATVAAQSAACQADRINQKQGTPSATSTTGAAVPVQATATSKCPSPAPASASQ